MRTCASDSGGGLERLLGRFFAAENARDWAAYASFLHPGVEWVLVDDGAERRIVGREEYLAAIAAAIAAACGGAGAVFSCLDMTVDRGRGRVVTLLVDDDGERCLDVFDVEDGLIRREWEFLLGRA